MQNLPFGDRDSVGFFQIRPSTNTVPPGFGRAPGTQVDGSWWVDHPEAQLAWATHRIRATAGGDLDVKLDDPAKLGAWAQSIEQSAFPDRYQEAYDRAHQLVERCRERSEGPAVRGHGARARALRAASSQLGAHETGDNTGARVEVFQRVTGAYKSPWCASFVTWSLGHAGIDMPGDRWAAVATWVNAARAGAHGLEVVSAADARPGDIVAFDWGYGEDFGSDGHIGFVDSPVSADGKFSTIEGNYQDSVGRAERHLSDANVVFMRVAR